MSESTLRIVWIYPDLLSTYGDRGNMLILARRAALRGIPVETFEVRSDQPMPSTADIYLIGGGEDGPQALAAQRLIADGGLHRAVNQGAAVLAVCAGYQLFGTRSSPRAPSAPAWACSTCSSDRGETRAVGELRGDIDPRLGLPPLTGFENHGGRTHLGPGVSPLARVTAGIGNDGQHRGRLARQDPRHVLARPALARNPAIADLLLRWATGADSLAPLDDTWADRLRARTARRSGRLTCTILFMHRRRQLGRYACMTDTLIAPRGIDSRGPSGCHGSLPVAPIRAPR